MAQQHGNGNSTEMVYRVEARSTYLVPQDANGMTLDNRWRQVEMMPSAVGVRNKAWSAEANRQGFLSYGAALALAHWFLANTDHVCIEARLVKIKLTSSYQTEEVGVSPAMTSFLAERDAAFTERRESPEAADAVDPSAASTGTPSTRDGKSS